MAFINDALVFDDLAAITGMPASSLVDGMFYACSDTGSGSPGWYQYKAGSSTALDSPNVIDATNGTGRFHLFGAQSSGGGGGVVMDELAGNGKGDISNDGAPGGDFSGSTLYISKAGGGSDSIKIWFGIDDTGTDGYYGWVYVNTYS